MTTETEQLLIEKNILINELVDQLKDTHKIIDTLKRDLDSLRGEMIKALERFDPSVRL